MEILQNGFVSEYPDLFVGRIVFDIYCIRLRPPCDEVRGLLDRFYVGKIFHTVCIYKLVFYHFHAFVRVFCRNTVIKMFDYTCRMDIVLYLLDE